MRIRPTSRRENMLRQCSIFVRYCIERDTLLRSIKTALVVGTILGIINHGQEWIAGQFSLHQLIPALITYLVPFAVATYGQVRGKRQRDLLRVNQVPAM